MYYTFIILVVKSLHTQKKQINQDFLAYNTLKLEL